MIQTKNRGKYRILPGNPEKMGASATKDGYNFAVEVSDGKKAELLLYRKGHQKPFLTVPLPEEERTGVISSVEITGLTVGKFSYAYRMDEAFCLDPYAGAVEGRETFGAPMEKEEGACCCLLPEYPVMRTTSLHRPYEETILYKLHVRGFTKDGSSRVKNKGTFRGVIEKIPYLKELGINAVELMPVFEFDEMKDFRMVDGRPVLNYWGYNTISFFAPNTSYTAETEFNREGNELKRLIRELNANGIECILDVVFNHTAEGNELGPCFSLTTIFTIC